MVNAYRISLSLYWFSRYQCLSADRSIVQAEVHVGVAARCSDLNVSFQPNASRHFATSGCLGSLVTLRTFRSFRRSDHEWALTSHKPGLVT